MYILFIFSFEKNVTFIFIHYNATIVQLIIKSKYLYSQYQFLIQGKLYNLH